MAITTNLPSTSETSLMSSSRTWMGTSVSFRSLFSISKPLRPRVRLRASLESAMCRSSSRTNLGMTIVPFTKPVLLMSAILPSIMALVSIRTRPLALNRPALPPRRERSWRIGARSRSRNNMTAMPREPRTTLRPMGAATPGQPGSLERLAEISAATTRPTTRPRVPDTSMLKLISMKTLRVHWIGVRTR